MTEKWKSGNLCYNINRLFQDIEINYFGLKRTRCSPPEKKSEVGGQTYLNLDD